LSDGWDFPPFQLTQDNKTGRLYGRGSSDDKGPVFGWINVLDAHHTLNKPLPVNLRFCFEGMEESGSEGLDEFILAEVKKGKDSWFDGVDAVCIVRIPTFLSPGCVSPHAFSRTTTGSIRAPPH
jgi:Cys-Gly metallodipeptidase DUG1